MSQTTRFLTNAPNQKIRDGEYAELSILTYALSANPYGRITAYQSGSSANYDTGALASVKNRITLPVEVPGAETFANVIRIDCSIRIASARQSEIQSFYTDQTCNPNPVRIGWLNVLGGIDRYTFTGDKVQEIAANRTTFVRELDYPITQEGRGDSVLKTTISDKQTIYSAFETEEVHLWLSEILSSPEVWIEDGAYHVPVVITARQTIVKDPKLIQMKLTYRMANSRVSQNG